jgi:DNA polymerase-1
LRIARRKDRIVKVKIFKSRLEGEEVTVHYPENVNDLGEFWKWFDRQPTMIGADIETTGKNVYAQDFQIRVVQVGDEYDGWVLNADVFPDVIRRIFATDHRYVFHNGMGFDVPALARRNFVDAWEFSKYIIDTQLLAHLIDPRPVEFGGIGLGLKQLCNYYVDPNSSDGNDELKKVFKDELSLTLKSGDGWRIIPVDHPVYLTYAGLDPILAKRLCNKLTPIIHERGMAKLAQKEHYVARIIMGEHIRGLRIDTDYIVSDLIPHLEEQRDVNSKVAARFGVENVNSNDQIIAALQGMGEEWSETTAGGKTGIKKPKVDGEVLRRMADLDKGWQRVNWREPNPLADAVIRGKRAGKWLQAYAYGMLDLCDENGRIHPNIKTLGARTGRMSISDPPLQQLPAGDWRIRRAIVPEDDWFIWSSDYAQIEMRVMAALADVRGMKEAISLGKSIHVYTADLIWPNGWDKNSWQYKTAKNTGFCKLFGGGYAKIAQTSAVSLEQATSIGKAWESAFPEVKRYDMSIQRRAKYGRPEVITPFGRVLPLDRKRIYSGVNYMIQSSARDIMLDGRIRIHEAGLDDYVLLEVHDEFLGQGPKDIVGDIAREVEKLMFTEFEGVPIDAEAEVYGLSWGHGKEFHMPEGTR